MDSLKLLAHPVRLRIIHALRGGRVLTAGRLCERVGEVSKATVYRHLELLTEAGVLEVAEERRVRGAVERHYRLRAEQAGLDAAQLAGADEGRPSRGLRRGDRRAAGRVRGVPRPSGF